MKITRSDFDAVAAFELLDPAVSSRMWAGLELRASRRPSFNFGNVASYFGALIVISAMGWFMTLGFENFGGAGIACIAAAYAGAFVAAGRWLWPREGQRVPAGLLFTMAVCMTPLFVYGLEQATGLWPQGAVDSYRSYHVNVKGSWLAMELATLAAAGLALRSVRFPFLVAPAAFTLWYMSMDLTPLLFGKDDFDWEERKLVSLVFGLGMLALAYVVDRLVREDFAFWLYLFGLMAFWGGLSTMNSDSELGKALYCVINLGLLGVGVLLRRRAFAVFGGLGVFGYLGHLSERVFRDSMLFPFALTGLGLGIIGAAVLYQRHRETLEGRVAQWIPPGLKALLPPSRE